jgi:hypothetical protein
MSPAERERLRERLRRFRDLPPEVQEDLLRRYGSRAEADPEANRAR